MRKFEMMVMAVFIAVAMFGAGEPEQQTIRVLHSGDNVFDNGTTFIGETTRLFNLKYPDITVEDSKIDLSDGSALTMDAMIAAGMPPNIYMDTMVRASKYMIPEFALPLDDYITDLDKYQPGILDPYRKDGKLMALPQAGGAQAMAINLDLMDDIGYTVPDNWTIDDFLEMAALVKAKYNGEKWATGMFAANQSGDYLMNNWFAAFGVDFYGPGGYDVSTIADTGGEVVYQFFNLLNENGYIPPNSAALCDDDYVMQWSDGNLAATAFFPSWMKPYWDASMKQGTIKEPFRVKYVPFPAMPGVSGVPVYFSNTAIIVNNTGTDIDTPAAYYAELLNGAWAQTEHLKRGKMSTRIDVVPNQDPYLLQVADIMAKNGIQDVGITDPRFTERRSLQFPILQKLLNGKISPADAIAEYQEKLTSVK